MHELPTKGDENIDIVEEGKQKRLYSWLFLCDDRKTSFNSRRNSSLITEQIL